MITRKTADKKLKKEDIAKTFVLHEENELVGPNLPFYYCRINANKILDGLFVGNQDAGHDLEFLMSIKCKYVINCVGGSVPNMFSRFGIRYLTFRWFDSKTCTIFDSQGKICRQIHRFIENALNNGNSVLVHSVYGDSRACLAIAAYLLLRFHWPLKKCLEFVAFKRPETNPKPEFIKQLMKSAKFLQITEPSTRTIEDRWCHETHPSSEEAVVTNTFLNSHTIRYPENEPVSKPKKKLRWSTELVHVFNESENVNNRNINNSDNEPISILKVRPSTPTIVPNKPSLQTSNIIVKNTENVTDIIQIHNDTDNVTNDVSTILDSDINKKIETLKKAIYTNESEEYLDSTLSYLSDTLSTLRVSRKPVPNQTSNNGNRKSHKVVKNSNKYKKVSRKAPANALGSIHTTNYGKNNSYSNLSLTGSSHISGLRVIGRSNDRIRISNNSRFGPSLNNNKPSKRKYNTRSIRKGHAPLYSRKQTPKRSAQSHRGVSNLSHNLMSDMRNKHFSNSSFPARRLVKTTSRDQIGFKSHQFKARIGANNLNSNSRMLNRPSSAPKRKNKSKVSNNTSHRRSNSARSKALHSAHIAQFRRVGW